MAIDYQRVFQNLIELRYSKEKFRFGYTDTQRTEASYKAFIEGLFGAGAERIVDTKAEANSSILLRPYENCDKYKEQEKLVKDNSSEFYKFQQTEIYKKTVAEVSTRLGFKYTLNSKQIDTIFDMCRYDQSWYLQEHSAWCAAFTPEHVNVLEYLEDLKYYYKSGPGSEINSNIMCAAMKDMMTTMKREDGPKVVAYFAHSSSIQLLLTALGYAKTETPLRADNYSEMKYRKYRSSVWSPLASNLAVVKYQ
jgi:multiple inositol-polyphosphate phosphatase / 2,3-bisphosphoglycerate 3-phosphatase